MLFPSVALLGLVIAAGMAWIMYPAALESELGIFRSLPPEAFFALRDDAIDFARTNASRGIVIDAGSDRSSVFELRCGGVPRDGIDVAQHCRDAASGTFLTEGHPAATSR